MGIYIYFVSPSLGGRICDTVRKLVAYAGCSIAFTPCFFLSQQAPGSAHIIVQYVQYGYGMALYY